MATLRYWLWLSTRKGMGPAGLLALLDHFGSPEAVHFADPEEYDLVPGLTKTGKASLLDKSMEEAERILADCDRLGQRIMALSDAGYPERLRNIYDPPLVLYLRGRDIAFDDEVVIGVIGTREPTAYGEAQAQKLGRELARQGAVVVSGLARGLDSEAIRGALRGGGTVAGVLGSGLDVVYPKENRFLYEDVAAAGLLISEYPPGTEPRGSNFPVRNRIISGLSLGVVVVEGAYGSGTRITARSAMEQDRDVFAVPGPVDGPMSFTPNDLIRRNEAVLITSASDILEEYQPIYPHKIHLTPGVDSGLPPVVPGTGSGRRGSRSDAPAPRDGEEDRSGEAPSRTRRGDTAKKEVDKSPEIPYIHWKKLTPALTDDQRDVLLALGDRTLTLDEIVEASQIPARRAGSAVTMLQLAGFLDESAGKRFSATVRIQAD